MKISSIVYAHQENPAEGINRRAQHSLVQLQQRVEYFGSNSIVVITEWIIIVIELVVFFFLAKMAIRRGERAGMELGFYYL